MKTAERIGANQHQSRKSQWTTSEIRRGKLIGSFSLPFIGLYGRGLNRGPVRIEGEKQTRFIGLHIRLQAFERFFSYKERPLHGIVMPPESNGTSGRVEDTALVGKVEHGSLDFSSVSSCDPVFSQPVGAPRPPIISFRIVTGYLEGLQMSFDRSQGLLARGIPLTHLDSRAADAL